MRILVLGGTRFVGFSVAAEAVRRGHEVVCAARGQAGRVPEGARLVRVDRDVEGGLEPLVGEGFDAVVDVATISYEWVRRALAAFGEQVGHWTFVSSISAYAEPGARPTGAGDPLLPPRTVHGTRELMKDDPDLYGSVKVASEQAVTAAVGAKAMIVRAGLITGPGDEHDRFGYWAQRLARGGRVLVPDVDHDIQIVDVRDLAAWIVDAAEKGTTGIFDGVGPARPLPDLLTAIADVLGADVEFVRASPDKLLELGVNPWAGPRSLPLWLPASHRYMASRDAAPALAAGLTPRSLADAVAGALDHERTLGLDRERKAGLTPEDEAEVIAALGA
ncbi:NAD-dependent epimerase/dehydratase family protein [Actinokineospora globicatena]|uniref:NAD-dependent epimerase/dehydratase family protein n=1 Tax=Actinokineospora globicatena TaxID=103729 RepID=UPI0020A5F638|nr:NAD-dependent epimerase/dehydratase family protein [Actinokineospora globicatena]MCP2301474.1 Nucleoside-diphosphate-sugar epimerase [Actinokineospora globicatena]GLW76880.1 reductase [Actinokineospora globicatena]GLW83713.1 reductase [Actinokineospora globicatena]